MSFNKTKEDFVWFIKKAIGDKKSDAYTELFNTLLKLFVNADTNRDGLVSKGKSFSRLIDDAAKLPREYGFAPADEDLYKNEEEKVASRNNMFESMDLKSTGVITFDEWLAFVLKHIAAKAATLDPHPILEHGDKADFVAFLKKAVEEGTPENTELYWYYLEMFMERDTNKDGNITKTRFPELVSKILELPIKLGLIKEDHEFFDGNSEILGAMFTKYNLRGDGNMSLDEWLSFANDQVTNKIVGSSFTDGFNKSKEDFIWFIKKAVSDKNSDAYTELFHTLLKLFVNADTNRDGLVSKGKSFSMLIDEAAKLPRKYGFAPADEDLYKNEEEKVAARNQMFETMDLKSTGVITFDEWLDFVLKHIAAKAATLDPHPILEHGEKEDYVSFLKKAVEEGTSENTELYWYHLEMFIDLDTNKDGNITKARFPELVSKILELPIKLGLIKEDHALFDGNTEKLEKIFKEYNLRGDGNMSLDEWVSFAKDQVTKKILQLCRD